MVLVVAIEGNIGVGKSTVLKNLKAHYAADKRVAFVDEPVGLWEENDLLSAMYEDRISRAAFQLMALTTRFATLQKVLRSEDADLVITERSIFSDRHCFAAVNLDKDSADATAYNVTHDALVTALPPGLQHASVLLAAPRRTVVERIAKRGRAAENKTEDEADDKNEGCGIPDAYLASLDDAHASYFEDHVEASARCRIDATASPAEVCAAVLASIVGLRSRAAEAEAEEEGRLLLEVAASDKLPPASPLTPAARSPTSVMGLDGGDKKAWLTKAATTMGSELSPVTSPRTSPKPMRRRPSLEGIMGSPSSR